MEETAEERWREREEATRWGKMYGTATAPSTSSIYSSISLLFSPSLLSFFFPLIFISVPFTLTHPDSLLSQVVQDVPVPYLFAFLLFYWFFFSISSSLPSTYRCPGSLWFMRKKVYLTWYYWWFFFPLTLIFTQRSHQDVNREEGAISIFCIHNYRRGFTAHALIMTRLFDSIGHGGAHYLFTDFLLKMSGGKNADDMDWFTY